MRSESYFDARSANINRRFFFLTGNTQDLFCDDTLRLVDIEWILHKELKANGYELVAFYDNELKLYCFDDESLTLLKKIKKTEVPLKSGSFSEKGGMQKGPLKGRLYKKRTTKEVESAISASSNNSSDGALNLGGMYDLTVFRRITGLMRDSEVKAAVIFTDALEFLKKCGDNRDWLNTFKKYRALTNRNIVVFIFLGHDFEDLNDNIFCSCESGSKKRVQSQMATAPIARG